MSILKKYVIIPFASFIYITLLLSGYVFFSILKLFLPIIDNFIIRIMKKEWLNLTIAYSSVFFPYPISVAYNANIRKIKRSLIISNHITNYDWLIILIVLQKFSLYDDVIIILKESLRKIPVFGHSMTLFKYIFLTRNWLRDKIILKNSIHKIIQQKNFHFLLFPEGTIFVTSQHAKSKAFAEKNNIMYNNSLFLPKNVLLPRTKGPNYILSSIHNSIESIIDITLFITPYSYYPQETHPYKDVYFYKTGQINFILYIDLIDPSNCIVYNTETENKVLKHDWLYFIFDKKDQLISKYTKMHQEYHPQQGLHSFQNQFNRMIQNKNLQYIQVKTTKSANICYLILFNIVLYIIYRLIVN